MKKIAVDIGHNCYPDIGASGVGDENIMNMDTGKKVIAKLQALGYQVLNVTPSNCNSVGNSLSQRVNIANSWCADFYVAIHYNCGGGHGVEIWAGSQSSVNIAQNVCNNIASLGFTNRGVKIQGENGYEHLYVLNNTNMPAILCEGCFVDSQDDMNKYNSEDMANAIIKGITGQVSNVTSNSINATQSVSTVNTVVASIQHAMNQLLFTSVDGQPIKEDGDKGNNTNFAINNFRKAMGFTISDGLWDTNCNTAYYQIIGKPLCNISNNKNVYANKYIQYRLFSGDIKQCDGIIGENTTARIRDWQTKYHISAATGNFDLTAWNHFINS